MYVLIECAKWDVFEYRPEPLGPHPDLGHASLQLSLGRRVKKQFMLWPDSSQVMYLELSCFLLHMLWWTKSHDVKLPVTH